jgi:FixJ family two-component response regulator
MPGTSGPELQQELKRRGREIPIIFITGQKDDTVRARVLKQGAAGFLLKPFSDSDLLAAIKTALHGTWGSAVNLGRNTMNSTRTHSHAVGVRPMSSDIPVVFIVDDDISVRESLELLVRSENWMPETAASAQEFLDHPRAPVPSCLVLDLSLPGLNGLELQKRLALERTEVPIIFVTGYGDIPKTVQAMKAGAVEFLTKPLNTDVLVSAIGKALERNRLALAHKGRWRNSAPATPRLLPESGRW